MEMTKVSVALYYWILVASVLLFARTMGLAENDAAIIKIIIVVTILYVGAVMITLNRGKKMVQKQRESRDTVKAGYPHHKKKKKK